MTSSARCGVIELRQYTMRAGQRDALIALFEREFISPQQAVGAHVLGVFRNVDDADHFVWMRGYRDMAARGRALPAFYDGPVWQMHRDAANATMVRSDDVLLLRPLTPWPEERAPGRWQVQVFAVPTPADDAMRAALRRSAPTWLETQPAPNNFPRHPIREGEQVLVALAPGEVLLPPELHERLAAPIQTLNLQPTLASPLR